jgi:hypothetical protein
LTFNASTGALSATSFSGSGANLTGIAATTNVRTDSLVVSGITTATGGINVGDSFIRSNQIGLGSTTTTGRNAGVGTATGTLVYNSTNSNIETYNGLNWFGLNGGYAGGLITSTIGSDWNFTTTCTLYNVTRFLNGATRVYISTSIFDITSGSLNTTDWTAPSSGNYKWGYVYSDISGSTFYLSNNAPSLGSNSRTIGGLERVYLFPIRYYNNSGSALFVKFDMIGNKWTYKARNAGYGGSSIRQQGWIMSYLGYGDAANSAKVVDVTSNYASTAHLLYIYILFGWKLRVDGGGVRTAGFSVYVPKNGIAGSDYYLMSIGRQMYTNTPIDGNIYYPDYFDSYNTIISPQEVDLTQLKSNYGFSNSGSGTVLDGATFISTNITEFLDRSIF